MPYLPQPISDIEYFQRKLSAALHVPLEYSQNSSVEPIVYEPMHSIFVVDYVYKPYEPDPVFISEEGMEFYSLPEIDFF